MGLKSNQKAIGSSHDIPATIAPVGMSCQTTCYCSSQGSRLGMVDAYSSSGKVRGIFQCYRSYLVGMKIPGQYYLISPRSVTQVCGIFNRRAIKFWRVTRSVGSSLYCVGVYGPSLASHSKGSNAFLKLGFLFISVWNLVGPLLSVIGSESAFWMLCLKACVNL